MLCARRQSSRSACILPCHHKWQQPFSMSSGSSSPNMPNVNTPLRIMHILGSWQTLQSSQVFNRWSKILKTKMVVSIASRIMRFASFCFVHNFFCDNIGGLLLSRNVPPVLFLFQILFNNFLVGGFNPLENISQIGNLPQIGVKIKNIWNHHQVFALEASHSFSQASSMVYTPLLISINRRRGPSSRPCPQPWWMLSREARQLT